MAAIPLPLISVDPTNVATTGKSVQGVQDIGKRSETFSELMKRPSGDEAKVVGATTTPPVNNVNAPSTIDEQTRTRRALELGNVNGAPAPTDGDAILGGIQKMRGIFDARLSGVNAEIKSNLVDSETMLALQKEFVQYTMALDVTSKLTGKAGQIVDQLMKGQ